MKILKSIINKIKLHLFPPQYTFEQNMIILGKILEIINTWATVRNKVSMDIVRKSSRGGGIIIPAIAKTSIKINKGKSKIIKGLKIKMDAEEIGVIARKRKV